MYYPHPNEELNNAFSKKPYQGVAPEEAKYLFIGLDANYDKKIHENKAYAEIIEYLQDGVTFWEKYCVHHPFLLPTYKGDGQFYHKSFSRIGLDKGYAKDVSFIELVDRPSYGKSSLDVDDLNMDHLARIKDVLEGDAVEYAFIPTSVGNLMKKSGVFSWLPSKPKPTNTSLKLWSAVGSTQLLWHYHFSVYGKFEAIKSEQLSDIGKLLKVDC